MGPVLVILIFIVLVGIAITGAIASQKAAQGRRDALAALANELGFRFDPSKDADHDDEYAQFEIFRRGHSRSAYNTLTGGIDPAGPDAGVGPIAVKMGDFTYQVTTSNGKTTSTHTYHFSYVILHLPYANVPNLLIRPEHMFDKLAGALGFDDIDFESAEFSRKFHVKSGDKKFAYDVCHPRMIEFLMNGTPPTIDIEHGRCCLFSGAKRWEPPEFKQALSWANAFFEQWPDYVVKELR